MATGTVHNFVAAYQELSAGAPHITASTKHARHSQRHRQCNSEVVAVLTAEHMDMLNNIGQSDQTQSTANLNDIDGSSNSSRGIDGRARGHTGTRSISASITNEHNTSSQPRRVPHQTAKIIIKGATIYCKDIRNTVTTAEAGREQTAEYWKEIHGRVRTKQGHKAPKAQATNNQSQLAQHRNFCRDKERVTYKVPGW